MNPMIDLYVTAVGARLPEKNRADIEKEIRSMILDTLEDESAKQGRPLDEAMTVEVLQRLGPPEKMAASYLPPRYLIGPELYPHFVTTLRIVLTVVAVLAAIGVGASLGTSSPSTPAGLGKAIGVGVSGVFNALIQALGIVVIIFAILQWTVPEFKLSSRVADWDPRKLRLEPDPEKVKIGEAVAEIVFSTIAIVILNVHPDWVGIYNQVNGEWVRFTLLTPEFLRLVPLFSVVWALEIGLNVWLLTTGRWNTFQRWAQVALNVANIGLMLALLLTPAIVVLSSAAVSTSGGLTAGQAAQVNEAMNTGARVVIGIVIAIVAVETGKHLYKLTLSGRLPALQS